MGDLDFTPLEGLIRLVDATPQRAVSLILYGLVKTMSQEARGCVFALSRLKELGAEDRQLAYALMELYAGGGNRDPRWAAAISRLDVAIGG